MLKIISAVWHNVKLDNLKASYYKGNINSYYNVFFDVLLLRYDAPRCVFIFCLSSLELDSAP